MRLTQEEISYCQNFVEKEILIHFGSFNPVVVLYTYFFQQKHPTDNTIKEDFTLSEDEELSLEDKIDKYCFSLNKYELCHEINISEEFDFKNKKDSFKEKIADGIILINNYNFQDNKNDLLKIMKKTLKTHSKNTSEKRTLETLLQIQFNGSFFNNDRIEKAKKENDVKALKLALFALSVYRDFIHEIAKDFEISIDPHKDFYTKNIMILKEELKKYPE